MLYPLSYEGRTVESSGGTGGLPRRLAAADDRRAWNPPRFHLLGVGQEWSPFSGHPWAFRGRLTTTCRASLRQPVDCGRLFPCCDGCRCSEPRDHRAVAEHRWMAQTVGLPTDQVRRRLLAVLFSGSGLTRIGFIAGITVATLVAEEMLGSATFVGLPVAGATIGIALGTTPIAALMSRYGRRPGLAAGMLVAAGGGVVAAFAAQLGLFPLLVAGMVLMGFGTAADRLARYAAAEVSPPERRSYAIGLVVWAGTIGSVVGPVLLEPVESLAEALGLEGLVARTC